MNNRYGLTGLFRYSIAIIFICISFKIYAVNPLNLYLTTDSTHADTSHSIGYPHAGMSSGTVYGSNDWNYINPMICFYLVPLGNQSFISADIIISWDSTMGHVLIQPGNLFTNYFLDTLYLTSGRIEINIASFNGNVMPAQNEFLIKVVLNVYKPGKSIIQFVSSDLRFFQNNSVQSIPTTAYNAMVKFYLGDFAATRPSYNTGDGKVNFSDVVNFGKCYGSQIGDSLYHAKFDIAPTQNGLDYWSMPVGDGKIDFSDLIVFATGYNDYGEGTLNRIVGDTGFSPAVSIGKPITIGNKVKIPLILDGTANDVRAISISFECENKNYQFESVEKNDIKNDNVFIAETRKGNIITIDAAVLGLLNPGFKSPCKLADLIFGAKDAAGKVKSGELNKNSIKLLNGSACNSLAKKLIKVKLEN